MSILTDKHSASSLSWIRSRTGVWTVGLLRGRGVGLFLLRSVRSRYCRQSWRAREAAGAQSSGNVFHFLWRYIRLVKTSGSSTIGSPAQQGSLKQGTVSSIMGHMVYSLKKEGVVRILKKKKKTSQRFLGYPGAFMALSPIAEITPSPISYSSRTFV